jgi:hypothetical protein
MTHYSIEIVWSDEDEGFIATVPDLPGCSARGVPWRRQHGKSKMPRRHGTKRAWRAANPCHSPASAVDRRSEFMQRPLTWMMGFAALYPSYALYRICGHVATLGARYRFMRALIIIPAEKPGGDQTVRATAGRRPGRMPGPSPREGKLAVGTTAAEWASAPATTRVAEGCRPWRWIPASCRNDGGWSNF